MLAKIGYVLIKLVSLLPFWVLFVIADFLMFIMCYIIGYRKAIIFNNLKKSFPEKSDKELRSIAKKFYKSFADTIICSVKLFSISEKEMKKRFSYRNPEVFQYHFDAGRNVIGMCGHYSNWEWIISTPLFFSNELQSWAVYQKLKNKFFDKMILDSRERFAFKMIPTFEAYETILGQENNGKHAFGMVADQSPHVNKIKHWLNFLNQDTPVHLGAENIAREKDYAVVFCCVQQVKRGYYEMVLENMFDSSATTEEYEITASFFNKLEGIIRQTPEHWLWSHRRWKHKQK